MFGNQNQGYSSILKKNWTTSCSNMSNFFDCFLLPLSMWCNKRGNKLIWLNQLKSLCEEHLSILGSRLIVVDVVDDFLFEKGIAKHFMSGSQVLRNFDSSNPTQNTKNQIEAVFFNCKEHTVLRTNWTQQIHGHQPINKGKQKHAIPNAHKKYRFLCMDWNWIYMYVQCTHCTFAVCCD